MSSRLLPAAAAVAALLLITGADAQVPSAAATRDPLDAKAPVPPVAHRSALGAYRASREVAVGSWRDANDTVTRIGGWRVYLREANEPDAAPSTAPDASTPSPRAAPAAPAPAASAPARPSTTPPSGSGHGRHGTH
jgi:hypothetical protein